MSDLILAREPVRVYPSIPEPSDWPCEGVRPGPISRCGVPAAGHVVWLIRQRIELADACGQHVAIARAVGGCVVFPLGTLPPPETLLAAVNAEIERRRRPRPTYSGFQYATTTAGGFNVNLGGQSWTIFFGGRP